MIRQNVNVNVTLFSYHWVGLVWAVWPCGWAFMQDLHVDQSNNMAHITAISKTLFKGDSLIVAGDVADSLAGVLTALRLLKQKFKR